MDDCRSPAHSETSFSALSMSDPGKRDQRVVHVRGVRARPGGGAGVAPS